MRYHFSSAPAAVVLLSRSPYGSLYQCIGSLTRKVRPELSTLNIVLLMLAELPRDLAANKRLNTAYLLKEQFRQLWSYRREPWARTTRSESSNGGAMAFAMKTISI